MQAKETPYDGCWFRSRLEARQAVFFNTLGLEYHYEPERLMLVPGGDYLPDFFLPELGYWIEVKGTYPTEEEQRKASLLSYSLALDDPPSNTQRVYVVYGGIPYPYPKQGSMIGYAVSQDVGANPDAEDGWGGMIGLCWQQCPYCRRIGIGKIGEVFCRECLLEIVGALENRICGWGHWWDATDLAWDLINPAAFKAGHKSPTLVKAYQAARSARFEGPRILPHL